MMFEIQDSNRNDPLLPGRPSQLLGQVLKDPALAQEMTTSFLVKIHSVSVCIICLYIV